MASNLINSGIIFDKNYIIRLEDKVSGMFNVNSKLNLKAPMSYNITFKIMIKIIDHQCLGLITTENQNWIWHEDVAI